MSKFGAKRTECFQGHMHDSKLEAGRCDDLHVLQMTGEISDLAQQPKFPVDINGVIVCTYIADFAYTTKGCDIIEDVKGMRTPVFNLKRKMVEAAYPGVMISIYPPVKRKSRKKPK